MITVGRESSYEGYKLLRFRARSKKLPEQNTSPGGLTRQNYLSFRLKVFPEAFDQHHGRNPLP